MGLYQWGDAANTSIIKLDGNIGIPVNTDNADYQAFLKSGETPDAYVAPLDPNAAAKAQSLALLDAYIATLNSTYGLSLSSSMSLTNAMAAINASSMTLAQAQTAVPLLKTYYDIYNSIGA